MKTICICSLIVLLLTLGGCTSENTGENIDTSSPIVTETPNNTEKDSANVGDINNSIKEVVDLPTELYKVENSASAQQLRHDFIVTEKTEFTITVVNDAGKFNLGIQNKDTKDYLYPMKEFQSDTDTVTLEKGNYSVMITESDFTGSYHIIGTSTK